ncbi:MAG: hypothetical protein QXW27_04515 [Candidatus Methanomethylicaceae archaeon]
MKLIAIPLASRIHRKEFYEKFINDLKPIFEKNEIKVLEVIDDKLSDEIINEVISSIPIIVILTGGTSDLAVELIEKSKVRRVLLLSHFQHNSLASAISIKNRVKEIAIRNYFGNKSIEKVIKISKALEKLLGIKVGVISDKIDVKKFEEILNAKVFRFGYECLEISNIDLSEVFSSINKKIEIIDNDAFKRAIELYLIMKKLVFNNQLNALAIDCFPYLIKYRITPCIAVALLNDDGIVTACEADLRALMLMLMAKSLGKISWMANIASINDKQLTIAHCTIATKLGVNCKLISHFESGLPYSLTCKLNEGEYTLVGINREYSLIATLKVKLIKSGLINENMCRTQALLEANVDLSDFPNIALGNHHILIPGDVVDDLKELANLLSIKFITYEKLINFS